MDSAWSYDDNEAVSINGFARESPFFGQCTILLVCMLPQWQITCHARWNIRPIFFKDPSGKEPRKRFEKRRCCVQLQTLSQKLLPSKGKLLSSRGRRVPCLCCCVVLTWKFRLAVIKLSPLSTVHPELFSDGGCVQKVPSTYCSAARRVAVCPGHFCIYFQTWSSLLTKFTGILRAIFFARRLVLLNQSSVFY